MKPTFQYDPEADAAYLRFADGKVAETEEVSSGIVLDHDEDGRIVGIEFLAASKRLPAAVLTAAMGDRP